MSDLQQNPETIQGRHLVSFRTSLLRNLMLLIAGLAAAILIISFFGARAAIRTLCQDLVTSGTDHVESNVSRFFAPISPVLELMQKWSEADLLEYGDAEQLNEALVPILDSIPQITGLSIGFADGSGYFLGRDPQVTDGTYQVQLVSAETAGKSSRWIKGVGGAGNKTEEVRNDGYDPRERPWYLGVNRSGDRSKIFWTRPYLFFGDKGPGMTASISIEIDTENPGVIAIDLTLEDISRLGETLQISPNGFLLVVTEDVELIGLPRHPALANEKAKAEAYLKTPGDLGIPLFTAASQQFLERLELQPREPLTLELAEAKAQTPFRWNFEGEGWWSYVRPYVVEGGPLLWIGVTVPESDFLGELEAGRTWALIISLIALSLACFVSIRLSRRYSRPIQSLIRQSERLRFLDTAEAVEPHSDIREIGQLYDAQNRMRIALDSFSRYVPSEVVRELLEKGEAAVIGGRNQSMSIFFTDIAGFTSIAEQLTPETLTAHMAEYFDAMLEVITSHHGTVDKLIGDAIVAFWGAPKDNPKHAHDAILAAIRCEEALSALNERWQSEGLPKLPTRYGISTGEVMVGNVGSANRLNYTALGDSVNLASRLEGANKHYGTRIIVSERSVSQTGDAFAWRKLDRVRVVGKSRPEVIYELLGERTKVSPQLLERAKQYETALACYWKRDLAEALGHLEPLLRKSNDNLAAIQLKTRCEEAMNIAENEAWDGVSTLHDK